MATTSIWAVKNSLADVVNYAQNPEKTEYKNLQNVLHYAENETKTEHRYFVTGINCFAETACEQMTNTKHRFANKGTNVAFHGYQSFAPGEVTPELAHEIGVRFASELWGDRYEVLVATHLNTDCYHNHFVVNSDSFVDGKKMVVKKGTHLDLRRVSDQLCREYGLLVIEKPKGKTPRSIYQAEKRGELTKYSLIRDALDRSIAVSYEPKDLARMLKLYGYVINAPENRKYVTICAVGGGKPTRLYQLGDDYTLERIQARIRQNTFDVQLNQPRYLKVQPQKAPNLHFHGNLKQAPRITGFRALYLHYLYLLGALPKGKHKPLSPAMREELRKLDRYIEQYHFLSREGLNTVSEVSDFVERKKAAMDEKIQARDKICNRLRRCYEPESIEELKIERDTITDEITILRKQIRLSGAVLNCVPAIKENILEEHRLQAQMRDETGKAQREREMKKQKARSRGWER